MTSVGRFEASSSGKLVVRAIEAKGTLAMDIGGTSDPYCVLRMNGLERKTKVVWRTLDPVWNEEFVFEVRSLEDAIQIEIWDKDTLAKDDFMGSLDIPISAFNEKTADAWFPIGDGKSSEKQSKKERGKLHLQITFYRYSLLSRVLLHDQGRMLAKIALQLPKPNQQVADAFTGLCEADATSLVNYMAPLFDDEVSKTNDTATLFRGDSMATKSLKAVSKQQGQGWLSQVLKPMVQHTMEIPISKIPNVDENPESSVQQLHQDCNRFLYQILGSMMYAPTGMRQLARALADSVTTKFPDQRIQAVGNFVFLRFFCPALSVPEAYGLCAADAPVEAKRYLLSVAKVLQVLANNTRFGTKDAGLSELNAFLDRNHPPFLKAFNEWISTAPTGGTFPPPELPYSDLLDRYDFLVGYLSENMQKFLTAGIFGDADKAEAIRKMIVQFTVLFAQQRLQQQDWNAKHAKKQKQSTDTPTK